MPGGSDTNSDHLSVDATAWLKQSFLPTHESHTKNHLAWRGLQLSKAKLKAASRTSALLSGFAMIAIVELQVEKKDNIPTPLLVAFAVTASLLVAVHIMALMISTCILPNLESYSSVHDHDAVLESPHEKMRNSNFMRMYIEMAWIFSTGLGILLFVVVIILATWVKFYPISMWAAGAASIVLGPVAIIFVIFAALFYRRLISHKFQHAAHMMHKLDAWMEQLDDNKTSTETRGAGDQQVSSSRNANQLLHV